ncbi:MAG: succinate dehydrogenase, cytochrome b556 subunit [Woeseiaceae bacterium]
MSREERPLSPHLTIYRWPITMTLSILHRMTGFALSVGLVAFVVWLEAIAWNVVPYDSLMEAMQSLVGQILLLGWLFSFSFHFANGIRHLIWDTGRLFEKRQADMSAWMVLVAAVLMTIAYWLAI